jgi:hypothetical protein
MNHDEINQKYGTNITFLHLLTITKSIPIHWKQKLSTISSIPINIPTEPSIQVNNSFKTLQNTTCKDIYWHMINTTPHTPTAICKWENKYPNFFHEYDNMWAPIFKRVFKTVRNTKLQTLQYRIIHRIVPCNYWLNNLKIKDNNLCSFCNNIDDISHFFLRCGKAEQLWQYFFNWWKSITKIDIIGIFPNYLEEYVLFGFPFENNCMKALNFCIAHVKNYIYHQKMLGVESLDLYTCHCKIKAALDIEHKICTKNQTPNFFKRFEVIYASL